MMLVAAPETVKRDRFAEAHGPAFSHAPAGLPVVQRFASFKEFSASGVIGDARRANAGRASPRPCRPHAAELTSSPGQV